MAIPMYVLYELGIILCRLLLKDKLAQQAREANEDTARGAAGE